MNGESSRAPHARSLTQVAETFVYLPIRTITGLPNRKVDVNGHWCLADARTGSGGTRITPRAGPKFVHVGRPRLGAQGSEFDETSCGQLRRKRFKVPSGSGAGS